MRRYRRPAPSRWCSCRRAPPRPRCNRRRRRDAPRPGRSRTRANSRTPRCARPSWVGTSRRSGETRSRGPNRTQQQQTSPAAHSVLTANRFRTAYDARMLPRFPELSQHPNAPGRFRYRLPFRRLVPDRAPQRRWDDWRLGGSGMLHPEVYFPPPTSKFPRRSGRLLDFQPELGDGLLAHHELLDLAGDGHREFADELDVPWDLVVGDLALTELLDLLRRGALALAQLDPGADLLAVLRIGHADHLHVLHLGMAVQELLDLAGIDVLAAADDHVLQPADDVDVAFGIHRREVAGMHPAA